MKSYSIENYIRWKKDIELKISKLPKITNGDYTVWNREQMIIGFTPLVENLGRKFSTSQQASGVMTIMDIIQEGNAGLTLAVGKLDYQTLSESEDQEKTIKRFQLKEYEVQYVELSILIVVDMRIPEHKLNEIRKNFGKDKKDG